MQFRRMKFLLIQNVGAGGHTTFIADSQNYNPLVCTKAQPIPSRNYELNRKLTVVNGLL